jgi:hypothetical protein
VLESAFIYLIYSGNCHLKTIFGKTSTWLVRMHESLERAEQRERERERTYAVHLITQTKFQCTSKHPTYYMNKQMDLIQNQHQHSQKENLSKVHHFSSIFPSSNPPPLSMLIFLFFSFVFPGEWSQNLKPLVPFMFSFPLGPYSGSLGQPPGSSALQKLPCPACAFLHGQSPAAGTGWRTGGN